MSDVVGLRVGVVRYVVVGMYFYLIFGGLYELCGNLLLMYLVVVEYLFVVDFVLGVMGCF